MLKSTKQVFCLVLVALSAALLLSPSMIVADTIGWDVAGSGDWDTTTTNWTADGGGRNDNLYLDGDDVSFSNTAGGVINLTADRAPGSTTVDATSGTYTFSGSNVTSGNLTKSGAGTLVLSSSYTGSGTILINGGTFQLGASDRISDTATVRGTTAGTLDMNGNNETMRWGSPVSFKMTNIGNLTVTNTSLTDKSGSQAISGSGSLNFGPGHNSTVMSGNHSYTGGTNINSGLFALYGANSHQLPATGPVSVTSGATFRLNWHNTASATKTIGALSGGGAVTSSANNLADTTFRVNNGGDSSTFSGIFSGAGNLVKTGAGTLTLDGNNTYTGTAPLGSTTVEDGTLLVNGTTGAGQFDYTIESGGTLGGDGTINLDASAAVIVEAGGTIAPGTSPGTLTINGDLTLLDGSFLEIEIGTISDLLVVNGELTGATSVGGVTIDITNLGGAGSEPIAFLDWSGGSETGVELSDFQLLNPDSGDLSISGSQLLFTAAVPEPSSLLSLALLFGLCARRRRRKVA